MPTYEYRCPKCDCVMQLFHKMNENPPVICPTCLLTNMVRGPGGGIATHFKGTGFYETDYKDKK